MITNLDHIKSSITTNNDGKPVPYRWTHGATDEHLGDGIIVYALIQHMRLKNCVCIGSGGGFIPRIITQARIDLHGQKIFEGNPDYSYGDIGVTYLVDACNNIGGPTDVGNEDSFYRKFFCPRFIKDTSENAYYNFFVRQDIKIDFLFIDGDHSYDGVKKDFELYTQILNDDGIVVIHDTDPDYEKSFIITEDEKKNFHPFDGPIKFVKELEKNPNWNLINLFNFRTLSTKPTSSGITIINRKK